MTFGGFLVVSLSLGCIAAASAASSFEPLVIVHPQPIVVAADEARHLVIDVNGVRAKHALSRVTVDTTLSRAALAYAHDMIARKFIGHVSPDGKSLPDRLAKIKYPWTVAEENIALGTDERAVHAALLKSPDHRANILDPRVRRIGTAAIRIGIGATLYVEEFVR